MLYFFGTWQEEKNMSDRIICCILALIIYVNTFPAIAYADENKAYQMYQDAIQATTSSGSWTEEMTMTADMSISQGKAKTKTKATLTSSMDISNYSANDLSDVKMSGSANMNVMGQDYAWNIKYEDGVAHYEYTEPNKTTASIEADPSCFNFNALTADMLKKSKVSGNKITFTIPGDKMEEAEIAAVSMMPGIENLNYEDVDAEVLIDKSTGAVNKMILEFHASLTYQGYDADVDYNIDYSFISSDGNTVTEPIETDIEDKDEGDTEDNITETEIDDGIIVYSDYQNLSIRKDSTITLSAGIIIGGEQIDDVSGITFWSDDSSILKIVDTGIKSNFRYVKFKGVDIGTTYVYFSDSNTGHSVEVLVTVYDNNQLSYTLNSVPTQYIGKYLANIYNNGLYIDSYNYSVNDNGSANVSFDVYNTNYTYGVVEIYNKDGTLKDAVLIDKMDSNSSSIKESVWDNVGCLVRDAINNNFLSYRQESGFSKKTSINSIKIPKNGYIKICNDPQNSAIVSIVNSVDVLMSLGKLAGKVKNYDVNADEFCGNLTRELVEGKAFVTLLEDGSELEEKLWEGMAKEVLFSTDSLGDFSETMANNLSNLDLGGLISDTAGDFGWSVAEDVFTFFTGPIDMVFDGLFAFGDLTDIIMQHTDLMQSSNVGSIYIQNQGGGFRSSQQITVKSDVDFSDDTSLNVFKVALDSDLLDVLEDINPDVYEKIVNGTSYTYNISLMNNGTEVQPDEEVTVYIPIPDDLKILSYIGKTKIYRVEEDGNVTEMDAEIKDGCFVFNTTHFSLYTLVGDSLMTTQNIVIALSGAILIVFILLLLFKIKKRKKQNNY